MILINNEVENNIDKDINNNETECLICFDKTTDLNNVNDMIILECNHSFCYDCLLESYKGVKCNFSNTIHRICPYCRKKAKLLPLKEGLVPIKGIHYHTKINKVKSKICIGIIKSGPNKGNLCSCKSKYNELYCGKHIKQQNIISILNT